MAERGRATVITHGCQMNDYDSARFRGILARAGYALTENPAESDFILLNTCAVRAHAEQRALGRLSELRGLRKTNPRLVLGIAGCVAKLRGAELLAQSNVVIYPEATDALAGVIDTLTSESRVILDRAPGNERAAPEPEPGAVQAQVTVMTGCSHGCAYCIVPRVRGPERSRPVGEIVAEIETLLARGIREITLLGQNVNVYGRDRGEAAAFPRLLETLGALDGLLRLRFLTSQPRAFAPELVAALASVPTLMPAVHLPAQHGSDRILAAMRRGYTAGEYLDLVARLRDRVPGFALSSDFIVGFPGETDADHAATLALARATRPATSFVFKFSPRPGTPAAALPDAVPAEVIAARHRELLALTDRLAAEQAAALVGTIAEVLVEPGEAGTIRGRGRDNRTVRAPGSAAPGTLATVRITASRGRALTGERAAG